MNITKTKLYTFILMFTSLRCQNTEQKNTAQFKYIETFQLVDEFNYNAVYPSSSPRYVAKTIVLNGQQYCSRYDIDALSGESNNLIKSIRCEIGECSDNHYGGVKPTAIPLHVIANSLAMKYQPQLPGSEDDRKRMELIDISYVYMSAREKIESKYNNEDDLFLIRCNTNTFLYKSRDNKVMVVLRYDGQTNNVNSLEYYAYEDWRRDIQKDIDSRKQMYNFLLEGYGL